MRTTLDLPDPLFRRLKARAALEGLSLKDLIADYVSAGLSREPPTFATQVPESSVGSATFVSAFDVMQDGVGIVASGETDLATNLAHMDRFGRD